MGGVRFVSPKEEMVRDHRVREQDRVGNDRAELTLGVGESNPGLSMLGGTWPVYVGVDFFLFWSCIVFSLLSLVL